MWSLQSCPISFNLCFLATCNISMKQILWPISFGKSHGNFKNRCFWKTYLPEKSLLCFIFFTFFLCVLSRYWRLSLYHKKTSFLVVMTIVDTIITRHFSDISFCCNKKYNIFLFFWNVKGLCVIWDLVCYLEGEKKQKKSSKVGRFWLPQKALFEFITFSGYHSNRAHLCKST